MTERHIIGGIVAGQAYEVRVRGIAGLVRGPWAASVLGTGQVDTTPPGVPAGLVAVGLIRAVALNWTQPSDLDLRSVEVWEAATFAGTYAKIGETGGTNFLRGGMPPGGSAWWKLRAVDRSGNLGAFTAAVQGTASLLLVDDIADGILNTAKFAAGIQPVGLVVTSPVPTTKAEEVIFHAPTNQLYRWDSATSAYVRVVRAVDVDGLLSSDQISGLDAAKLSGVVSGALLDGVAAAKVTGQLTDAQIAAVAAAKVTGTIGTSQIAAGAVTANKLLISDNQNLLLNGDLAYGLDDWSRIIGNVARVTGADVPAGAPAPAALRLIRTNAEVSISQGTLSFHDDAAFQYGVPCNVRDQFVAEAWIRTNVGGSNYFADVVIRRQSDGAAVGIVGNPLCQ